MFIYFGIFIVFVLLVVFIYMCIITEKFTAPGLTLTRPPKWFPKYSAKKYNMDDWKVKMYLDRYPMYNYQTTEEANTVASTNRFWKI